MPKEILNLNNKKASENSDIPTKIIKENSDIYGKVLCSFINDSFTFPTCLKEADVTPIHKKVRKVRKKTIGQSAFYQPYQKYLKELRLYKCLIFLKTFFNKQQCGFRKGYNTQQCLLKMLEKWK